MTSVTDPAADCGNDCFTPDGHREGCWQHCHCYDGEQVTDPARTTDSAGEAT